MYNHDNTISDNNNKIDDDDYGVNKNMLKVF